MQERVRFLLITVIISCLLMNGLPRGSCVSSQDASTAIANAEHALEAAFVNVSAAEKAGANVSELLTRLEVAGYDLTEAEAAQNSTPANYSAAVTDAMVGTALADDIATDASVLKNEVGSRLFSSYSSVLIIGFLAASSVVVILVVAWTWFKRHYIKNMSKLHPEVNG